MGFKTRKARVGLHAFALSEGEQVMAARGYKISTIKDVRERLQCNLLRAKVMVDSYEQGLTPEEAELLYKRCQAEAAARCGDWD